jgi:hypothetical protein
MNSVEGSVSLHPYFKVRPGQLEVAAGLLREFVAQTAREPKMIYYEFTQDGDAIFCREAYADAHLTNVGPILERMLAIADVTRVEVHGPAAELEKLKGPLGALNPQWFTYQCGVRR